MMTGLRLRNISVNYGERKILKNLNLDISRGEFCGLLGLNGSGKTTLLHVACGFLPMQGECYVDGENCKILMNDSVQEKSHLYLRFAALPEAEML